MQHVHRRYTMRNWAGFWPKSIMVRLGKLAAIVGVIVLVFYRGGAVEAHRSVPEQIDNRLQSGTVGVGWCSWSPDGDTIVFDANLNGNKDIYSIDSDGDNMFQMTVSRAIDS